MKWLLATAAIVFTVYRWWRRNFIGSHYLPKEPDGYIGAPMDDTDVLQLCADHEPTRLLLGVSASYLIQQGYTVNVVPRLALFAGMSALFAQNFGC